MKSLVQLQSEIQSLQQQASQLRSREFDRTVTEIVEQMAAFGITLGHLKDALQRAPKAGRGRPAKGARGRPGRPKGSKAAAQSKEKGKDKGKDKGKSQAKANGKARPKGKAKVNGARTGTRKPAAIKFKGPNGEAWSGRGKTPTWLKAQIEAGKQPDDFRI